MDENGAQEHRDASILGALPRTRPQRSSPRRASTRTKAAKQAEKPAREKRAARSSSGTTRAASRTARPSVGKAGAAKASPPRRREPPAPAQGWEAQEEPKRGATVHPPNGVELVESVATIFAELGSAVLKAGGRVLKDALSPLHKP